MTENSTVIDDLIILGRACPEEISDGRQTICTAGYSEAYGFIRLYPTRYDSPLKSWSIVKVPVEKPVKPQYDGRRESWKIVGSKSEWDKLSGKIENIGVLPRSERPKLIESLVDGCVNAIIEEDRTLGIIKPVSMEPYFEEQEPVKLSQQTLDKSFRLRVKENYDVIPRMKYKCSNCSIKGKSHDQQILEWGVYEWIRKKPNEYNKVWDNLRLMDEEYEKHLLVGNLYLYPKTFNIISVIRYKRKLVN